ncbi:MAG: hypothetical protein NVSMB2_04060 [Chloroflexota bacterium]
MDTTIFVLGLYHAGSQTVDVVWQVEKGKELSGGSFPLGGTGLASRVISTGRSVLIRNWEVDGPPVTLQFATRTRGLPQSALAVPLVSHEHVIGFMSVQSYEKDAYGDAQLAVLESLAVESASVINGLNISERTNAQARAELPDRDAIVANITDGLLTIDARGRIVIINRVAREMLTEDDSSIIVGQRLSARSPAWSCAGRAMAEALEPIIDQLLLTHAAQQLEVDVQGRVRRTLYVRTVPVVDSNGPIGGLIFFNDVTNRREMERIKDDMFSIATHDLKTPATVIKTEAQILQRHLRQGDHSYFEEGLTNITAQVDRLAKMVDNLLIDLSQIEAGGLKLHRAPTDLRDVVNRMVRALGSISRRHTIRVEAPPRALVGLWDPDRLEEVMQNLLSNAIKYSPEGGCIDVRVCEDEHDAVVAVRDHGIGLAEEDAPHVFERFYRGRGQTVEGVEGTGLGLYICQAIISGHGGRIWTESAGPGHGSTFALSLPLDDDAVATG